ncbi:MAG TPA: permease-like cell division protein FtsX [Bacteroidales bacterium]|nr:permease-like cell division protein FtsX [Bacteroidales bacterium]
MTELQVGSSRLRASYITSIISIMLVLFMIGLLGMIIIHGKKLSDYVRENISISLMLKDNLADEQVQNYMKRLQNTSYVKQAEFISREQAAKQLSNELGEDFVEFLGYNPLPASIDIQLKAGYANNDSISRIERQILSSNLVKEVVYQKSLIDQVNSNISKISMVIISFSLILLIISVILINNTIKLSIYARRFLIRSMQLVGATENFIRMPFIKRSALHGIIAAVLADLLLIATLYVARQRIPEIVALEDISVFAVFFVAVLVVGVILSAVSTWISVNKFLKMKIDSLYSN